jgi:hypothetical protein
MKIKQTHSFTQSCRTARSRQPLRNYGYQMIGSSLLALFSSFTIAEAKVLEFDLSPTGASPAVGLSPANEVPAVVGTGKGGTISGGIFFDTDTSLLSFAMGYGSAAGFTDLTGAGTGLHIHGPAAATASAPVLFDLSPVHFPAADPTKGGVVYGSLTLSPAQATDLLASLDYVNIHTAANPNGEIRGQLVRLNSAPDITGLQDVTVECGVSKTYSATISDYDGDAVQAVWSVNGVPVETDSISATGTPSNVSVFYRAKLPHGIHLLTMTATDSKGNVTVMDSSVTVEDTIAPVIVSASADPKVLWPPNHKMINVNVTAKVEDACGHTTWKIVSVKSSQPTSGKGDVTPTDFKITGDHTVSLRAERTGKDKNGRVYSITIQAVDESGNKSLRKVVTVKVPHDKGKGK